MDQDAVDFREKLPEEQAMRERFAIQLRLMEGASFPAELESTVDKLVGQQLLVRQGSSAKLSEKGLLFHDTVACEIV
jgi:coproporphyrinogen III oxidase-like Fe-S oxidoreductase